MLQVTRRVGEDILIATEQGLIRVTVMQLKGNQAAIAVRAPKEIAIYRREVLDRLLIEAGFDPDEVIESQKKLKSAITFLKNQHEIDKKENAKQ